MCWCNPLVRTPRCGNVDCKPPTNALGEPSPNRTDFTRWARANLEAFARQAADENLLLRHEVAQLKLDLATALAAWRKCAVAGRSDAAMTTFTEGPLGVKEGGNG